jgi:hypothetical protein
MCGRSSRKLLRQETPSVTLTIPASVHSPTVIYRCTTLLSSEVQFDILSTHIRAIMTSNSQDKWQIIKWITHRLHANFRPDVQAQLNPPPHLVSLAAPHHCPSVICWLPECALQRYHPIDRCLHFNINMDATERATALAKDHRCWTCFEQTTDPEKHNSQNCSHPRSCPRGSIFHQQLLHGANFVTSTPPLIGLDPIEFTQLLVFFPWCPGNSPYGRLTRLCFSCFSSVRTLLSPCSLFINPYLFCSLTGPFRETQKFR